MRRIDCRFEIYKDPLDRFAIFLLDRIRLAPNVTRNKSDDILTGANIVFYVLDR